jgi:hypothetical protein
MEAKITRQAPKVRCYKCGSADIEVICHHCGRPLCKSHGPVKPVFGLFLENREFNKLRLGNWPLSNSEGAHCDDCVHSSPNYRRIMIFPGALIIIASLYWGFSSIPHLLQCLSTLPPKFIAGPGVWTEALRDPAIYEGITGAICYQPDLISRIISFFQFLLFFLYGAGLLIVGSYLNRERIASDMANWRPNIPLGPMTRGLQVEEVIKANLRMDKESKVSMKIEKASGAIRPSLQFSKLDLAQIDAYQKKYNLRQNEPLSFDAGYLLLSGRPDISMVSVSSNQQYHPYLFPLDGDVKMYEYLHQRKGSPAYNVDREYDLILKGSSDDIVNNLKNVPVRLIPIIKENRSLSIEIQINVTDFPLIQPISRDKRELLNQDEIIILEDFSLVIDHSLFGHPKANTMIFEQEDGCTSKVVWRDVVIPIKNKVFNHKLSSISFTQLVEPDAILTGNLRMRFPALRSGLETVRYFSPLGFLVQEPENNTEPMDCEVATVLELKFEIALANMPKARPVFESSIPISRPFTPDPVHLQPLFEKLNWYDSPGNESYIREIVQDPKRFSENDSKLYRWHWSIVGRRYENMLPVDFQIIAYGHGSDEKRYPNNCTQMEINVRGYDIDSNGNDEITPQHIQIAKSHIIDCIDRTQEN